MKRIISLSVVAVCVFSTTDADADFVNWVLSPNSNQSGTNTAVSWSGNDLTIGTSTSEITQQTMGIYGAGAALPTGYTQYQISFDWSFSTWDSYNDPLTPGPGGKGWWDSFSATITKGDYYWNEALTDPITTDPDIEDILLLEAGTAYGDGVLEVYTGTGGMFVFQPPDGDQYYLNLVIDTLTAPNNNGAYASWGSFTDVTVTPVPAAVLLGVIGLGAAALKLRKFS